MSAKKNTKRFNMFLALLLAIFCTVLGCGIGYYGYLSYTVPTGTQVYTTSELQVHFLELGNKYTGDCTYIKVGDTDVLIDAGSKVSSIPTITQYLDTYVTDGKLEYVIVTHSHEDHYAGFATNETTDSIFDIYECEVIIDFAQATNTSTKMYSNYQRELSEAIERGATHYTAADCITGNNREFKLSNDVTLTILDQKYYYEPASNENNHSVCCLISTGEDNFLFTGDLEKEGEQSLVELNELPEVTVYKAGHHGSRTSSHEPLLSTVRPKIVCVCCCAGSTEYNAAPQNRFPTQDFVDRVSKYTDAVYVTTLCNSYEDNDFTSMNGNIVISFAGGTLTVSCSASDKKLKDSDWFKNNRDCPESWS